MSGPERTRADRLWTRADIARSLLVSEPTVDGWILRFEDFPKPVATERSPGYPRELYSPAEVKAWVAAQRKRDSRFGVSQEARAAEREAEAEWLASRQP